MAKDRKRSHQIFKLEEPEAVYTTRLRPIGNSRGVILNSDLLNKAGLNAEQNIQIQAAKGAIVIIQAIDDSQELSSWDKQFREAKKKGSLPEKDLFEGMGNKFDKEEW